MFFVYCAFVELVVFQILKKFKTKGGITAFYFLRYTEKRQPGAQECCQLSFDDMHKR